MKKDKEFNIKGISSNLAYDYSRSNQQLEDTMLGSQRLTQDQNMT